MRGVKRWCWLSTSSIGSKNEKEIEDSKSWRSAGRMYGLPGHGSGSWDAIENRRRPCCSLFCSRRPTGFGQRERGGRRVGSNAPHCARSWALSFAGNSDSFLPGAQDWQDAFGQSSLRRRMEKTKPLQSAMVQRVGDDDWQDQGAERLSGRHEFSHERGEFGKVLKKRNT